MVEGIRVIGIVEAILGLHGLFNFARDASFGFGMPAAIILIVIYFLIFDGIVRLLAGKGIWSLVNN